ncbi:type II secretion system F family protein [Candidatus Wolfebacteria bacterium]|nr:type II secretion system F family protein [Candidatus Wolfebacteria bacterium]
MIFNRVSAQEKINFIKNLTVMIKSGIVLNEALGFLIDQTKSKVLRRIILTAKNDVESGIPLSESLSKEKEIFGEIFINFLKVGEVSGTLDENLVFLADWMERNYDLTQEIKAATLYPKFVIGATFLLGGALTVYILPKIVPLFAQLKVELPFTTKVLIAFSLFLRDYWYAVILGTIIIYIAFKILNRIRSVKRVFHWFYIKTPFIGRIIVDYQLALIASLFATIFKAGLSLGESLGVVAKAMTNVNYQDSIKEIERRVNMGTSLSESMAAFPKLYPKSVVNIIATGERSGALDRSFEYLAEFYSKEVHNKTKKLPTILEPALLIFIAIIVGFVALSIIMPIYDLTRGLGGE